MFSVLFGIRRLEAGSVTSQIVWKANPVEGESLQCSNTAAHSWTCEMKILFAYLYILGSLIRGGGVDAILGLSMWQLYAFVFFKTHVRHKIFKMNMITAFLHGPPVTAGPPQSFPSYVRPCAGVERNWIHWLTCYTLIKMHRYLYHIIICQFCATSYMSSATFQTVISYFLLHYIYFTAVSS